MKNLAHLPIEKLELQPSYLSMRWNPHKGWTLKQYDRYYRENWAWLRLYRKLHRLIEGSVGHEWNKIYSTLCKLTNNLSYSFHLDSLIKHKVAIPYWQVKEKRWKFMRGFSSYEYDLYEYIQSLRRIKTSYFVEPFYYVSPTTGRLRMIKSRRLFKYKK